MVTSSRYLEAPRWLRAFVRAHETSLVVLAALIAVGTAYGGLRIFLARHGGTRLTLSAIAFGFAVAGMHYTATYGMTFVPAPDVMHPAGGLIAVEPDVTRKIESAASPTTLLVVGGTPGAAYEIGAWEQ